VIPSRQRWNVALVLSIAVALLGADKGPKPPAPRGTWIEARTENFVLFSNASEKQTKDVARQLEQFRALLARITTHIRLSSPAPTSMLVFDGEKSFTPYNTDSDVRGMFAPRPDGNFAAFIARPYIAPSARNLRDDAHFPYDTVYHEYVHYVLRNNFANMPRWLNEGMAQYYATFRVDGDVAQVGFPRRLHLNNLLYGPWIPLADLLRDGPMSGHELLTGQFYCESWFITHYILNGSETRRGQLDAYLGLVAKGIRSDQAFRQAFETDLEAFTVELRKYLASNQFYMASAPLGDATSAMDVRLSPMSAADVLTDLGVLTRRILTPGVKFFTRQGGPPEGAWRRHAPVV